MSFEDPTSRKLRGQLGNAIRWGDEELAEKYRQLLRVANIERSIRKQLKDAGPLTVGQAGVLSAAIYEHVDPDPVKRAAAARAEQEERAREQAEIESQIAELQTQLEAVLPPVESGLEQVTQSA